MTGARFVRVRLNRPDLRVPFSERFIERLRGRTVPALTRRGKYLLASLDSGETLVIHLGMSGSFRIEPTGTRRAADVVETRHDHVVFEMSSGGHHLQRSPTVRSHGSAGCQQPGRARRIAASVRNRCRRAFTPRFSRHLSPDA